MEVLTTRRERVESPPSHDRAVGERPLDDLAIASGRSSGVEKLIRQTVAEARKQGRTWAEIGTRFASRSSRPGSSTPGEE